MRFLTFKLVVFESGMSYIFSQHLLVPRIKQLLVRSTEEPFPQGGPQQVLSQLCCIYDCIQTPKFAIPKMETISCEQSISDV